MCYVANNSNQFVDIQERNNNDLDLFFISAID